MNNLWSLAYTHPFGTEIVLSMVLLLVLFLLCWLAQSILADMRKRHEIAESAAYDRGIRDGIAQGRLQGARDERERLTPKRDGQGHFVSKGAVTPAGTTPAAE